MSAGPSFVSFYAHAKESVRANLMDVCRMLPALAIHLGSTALSDLTKAHTWLEAFEPGSKRELDSATTEFMKNGPACLDVITKYTKLMRLENQLGLVCRWDTNSTVPLLINICRDLEKHRFEHRISWAMAGTASETEIRWPSRLLRYDDRSNGIRPFDLDDATRDRVDSMARQRLKATERVWLDEGADSGVVEAIICQCFYHWLLQNKIIKRQGQTKADMRKIYCGYIQAWSRHLNASDNTTSGALWICYRGKVKSFVQRVGCAKVHDEPDENIAELRLFYSTTIGYFAKLQDQYLQKELEIRNLQRIISALQFRHLLEQLTPPHQPGTIWSDRNSGPRWMKFWEEALKVEFKDYLNPSAGGHSHALRSIMSARNPNRGTIDKSTGALLISTDGQKGQFYREGSNLYGLLSDEIHHFHEGKFVVEDAGWPTLTADALRALRPLEKNIDKITGEVDWDAERSRFL
ncbi:hypothetical protein F4777DRAFT_531792 [Nemania sp. FL0916]|nr:hypothetical protein F4777DRAFT_531792 [Nemania sp. FL0916]